jgi:hypothetical protein
MYKRIILVFAGMLATSACFADDAALPTLVAYVTAVNKDGGLVLNVAEGTGAMKAMAGKDLTCYLEDGAKVKPVKGDRLKGAVKFVKGETSSRYVLQNVEMLPPGSPLPYKIIKSDRTPNVRSEIALVIEGGEQLVELWKVLYENIAEKPKMPDIDFDTQAFLVIFMGTQDGKESHLEIIDITETAKSVNVYIRYVEKGDRDKAANPYLLITMERRPLPIVFIDETPRPDADYWVKAETIAEGDKSSLDKEETTLIENEEQFKAAWERIYAYKKEKPELPTVDFDRETVLLAAWGMKRDAGYSVSVPAVYQRDNIVHVSVLKHIPTHSGGRGHFQPFVVVKFPKPQAPIVIQYEMEMVGEPLEGATCKVEAVAGATVNTPEKAAELAKASGMDEAATKKLTVVNYDQNMAVVLFTGSITSAVRIKMDRVYRTDKQIVVEISAGRAEEGKALPGGAPVMQVDIFITEKSDLPIVVEKSRTKKENAYPFKPLPESPQK